MATLNSAIAALVDNLHGKMTSNAPLSAEEQTLVASAIEKLTAQTNWEGALVAVAEEHLDTATQTMSQTLTTATNALTNAEGDINQAKDAIQSQNANLTLIPQIKSEVQTALNGFGTSNSTELRSNLAGMARPVFGFKKIETSGANNFQRSPTVFAVYDANGESFLVRPSYTNATTTNENNRLEYLKLAADGSNKTSIKTHFLHNSTFYASPNTYIYSHGSSAILPLASKDDATNIAYDVVYSAQSSAGTSTTNYGGIFCAGGGNTTITKPKQNLNATDQWGIPTVTTHQYYEAGVLYDNTKHCLVVVDTDTSLLVEKYRDGNIITTTSIANAAALQAYVDGGDFTVVRFIYHYFRWPSCYLQYNGNATTTSESYYRNCYGFYGKLGSELKMGGNQHNAHYRFTAAKKLEPLNYFFTSTVDQSSAQDANGAANSTADLTVSVTDMQGNTLGIYQYQSKSDYSGYQTGYIASALMCMNPYSHVGILNDHVTYSGTTANYGHGRICKAF